jgi:uncharacterized protein
MRPYAVLNGSQRISPWLVCRVWTSLHGVIEKFITRDSTDYGLVEATLDPKINDVMRQVEKGDAVIVYDEAPHRPPIS